MPKIEFTQVPEAGPGGSAKLVNIAGRVTGAREGQAIVLYAKSGTWWVQPMAKKPFTAIAPQGDWTNSTHLGTDYAALLVEPGFVPPKTADTLPSAAKGVIASAFIPGKQSQSISAPMPKSVHFSGYDWDALQIPSESGGLMHDNLASNVWVDANGWLHLRITKVSDKWTCGEVSLSRSLGYGSYSFVVRQHPPLEPGSVLGMFTWDPQEAGQNHREIDIELSQWGDPHSKNAQFAIQPYYVPANVYRFNSPSTPATHSFQWEPGKVSFRSFVTSSSRVISSHVFTSGIPSPGGEKVNINLYTYGKSRTPQMKDTEVIIERFEYLR